MSVFVVRAFVKMREALNATADLARQLKELEAKLTSRLDVHETAIVEVLQRIMDILKPAPEPPEPPHKQIGFHIKEDRVPYRIKRRTLCYQPVLFCFVEYSGWSGAMVNRYEQSISGAGEAKIHFAKSLLFNCSGKCIVVMNSRRYYTLFQPYSDNCVKLLTSSIVWPR